MERRQVLISLAALALAGTPKAAFAGTPTVEVGTTDGTWKTLRTYGAKPSERSAPAAAGIDRYVLHFGGVHDSFATGQNTFFNDLHRLDTRTGQWVEIPSPSAVTPEPRAFAGSAVSGRSFVVFGGSQYSANGSQLTAFDDLWALDTERLRWSRISPVNQGPSGRSGPTVWATSSRLYVFGGIDATFTTLNDLWAYDIKGNSWTQLGKAGDPAAPGPRHIARAGGVAVNGKLTLYGGEDLTSTGFVVLPDTWQFDIGRNAWTDVTPRKDNIDPPRDFGAAGVIGTRLYLHGGDLPGGEAGCGAPFDQNPTADLWSFDLVARTWRRHLPAGTPARLKWHAAAVVGGQLYITSGWDFQCDGGVGPGQIWNRETYVFKP